MLFWGMAKIEVKTRCSKKPQYFVRRRSPYSLGKGKHKMLLLLCSQLYRRRQCRHACDHLSLLISWYGFLPAMKNKTIKKINTSSLKTWCAKDFIGKKFHLLLSINSKTFVNFFLSVKNVSLFVDEVFTDKENS